MASRYDLVVIGAGTGGYVAAIRAAQIGLKTAVVERQPVLGGTCLNWGCIPTKVLLEHAHALGVVQASAEWGIAFDQNPGDVRIDMPKVHERQDSVVAGLTRGVEFLFKKNGIDWIKGTARLAGAGSVDVMGDAPRTLTAREIIVATGSTPRALPAVPVDRRNIITSDQAIHLPKVPVSIAVLGAGAVGVEFASIFRAFGSEVTIVELQPRLVPGEDEAVSAELSRVFRKRGITVRTATKVTGAEVLDGSVRLTLEDAAGKSVTLDVEKVLVATGRAPVTEGLGAEDAGLILERGYIRVDPLFRTGVPGISAIGDVITMGNGSAHPQLAHVSSREGVILAERLAGRDVEPIDYDLVPSCTYCDPEIGRAGLTEAEARARGYDVRTGTFPFSALGRARIAGRTAGFVKIVTEKKYDQVLGVHIVGANATEIVAEAAVALRLEATVEELIRTIHAHPTMAEAMGEAAHAVHGAPIHS